MNLYEKYRNPDRHCRYPWTPDPVGYCWGYAVAIDKGRDAERIKGMCMNCECYDLSENFDATLGMIYPEDKT